MEYTSVVTLIDTISKSNVMNFEMEEGNFKIKIDKRSQLMEATQNNRIANDMNGVTSNVANNVSSNINNMSNSVNNTVSVANDVKVEEVADDSVKMIQSPIVGTFYSSSGEDSEDYVKVGDTVKKGQTLCIVEAMKLMNEIESDYDGEILEILVKNEQVVEYNQPLFKIKVK